MPRRRRPAAKRAPAKKAAPGRRPAKKAAPTAPGRTARYEPTRALRSAALNVTRTNSDRQQIEDLKRALGHADIISLSEVKSNDQLLKWAKRNGFGVYMAKGRAADSAIIWNKNEVELVGDPESVKLNDLEGKKGGARSRFAAYAQFKDKVSGQTFWQIAAHTVPMGTGNRNLRKKIQTQQYSALAKLTAELSASAPVILSGDLNFKRPEIAGLTTTRSGYGVMHVMSSNGLNVRKSKMIGGFNSDKRLAVTKFRFGKGKGGTITPEPELDGGGPEEPLEVPEGLASLKLPAPPTFQGFWEGDHGGGPKQVAPGLAPKKNGAPLVDDDPGLSIRTDINLATAAEMVTKVSPNFFFATGG